ncbi:hypothetical protein [Streptomyces sp. LNU-CPARS28]|uniref:hypothetical protein n=1 Tax=Streptomyces sp. LNU-CPARS28 TaxID=3137371 RepID=UPI00313643BB
MTEPRHTADTITDDELDALYERLAKAEHEADAAVAAAAQLTTLVGKRSEKAEKTAKAQRQRADIAETELHVLRSGLRANGADPTQIQNLWAQIRLRNRQWREEKQRASTAEATIERVRALVADLEGITGARTWAGWLRDAIAHDHPGTTAPRATGIEKTARVLALYEQWVKAGPPPLGTSVSRWWDARLVELHDAIRPPTT